MQKEPRSIAARPSRAREAAVLREVMALTTGIIFFSAGIILAALHGPHTVALISRILGVVALLIFAVLRRSLSVWMFVAMVVGAELGFDAPKLAVQMRFLSDIFLRLIQCVVAPLIFAMLVVGIAGHGDIKSVGRMGIKSLVYFEVITTLALAIGLLAINISKAGVGLAFTPAGSPLAAPPPTHWNDFLVHVFPENFAKSVAEGQILQVAVFAIIFGIALALVQESRRAPMLRFCESLAEVMFRFTNIVMYYAPVAIAGAMAFTIGGLGLGVLVNVGKLLLTLFVALIVFAVGVLLPVAILFRVPVMGFLRAVAEPATIAFATSTSQAALPSAMEQMEAFGVPARIVAFVIPAGYSFNLDGSTLYLAVTAIFVAQAAGMHLTLGQQLLMMLTLMLASKGVAGVPRSMLIVLLGTASTFHLPTEPIFILLGVDTLMDMARTTVNVVGNCLASAVIAKWENAFRTEEPSPAALEAAID
ncbi:MAG TPA: cation:dicarboxylase symporter family transporter [Acidobacteriaceae bacterium]|nr:cation:dicarboxylase symporter family transporter [Acidobacteriaceae bacterium]